MGIPATMKDTKTYYMVGGLDRSTLAAQELMFNGDLLAVDNVQLGAYWPDRRYDWTSGDLDYIGLHTTHKTATSTATWNVWKLTWSSGNLTRFEGPLVGSWDNRASLSWGS